MKRTDTIEISVMQTEDVAVAEAVWVLDFTPDDDPDSTAWRQERSIPVAGAAKRRPDDKRDPKKGRDLATLRALRKLVKRLEDEIGPDAHDAPKELPPIVVTIEADTSGFDAAITQIQADFAGAARAVDALQATLTADDVLRPGDLVTCPNAADSARNLKKSNLFVWTGGARMNASWFDDGVPCYLDNSTVKVAPADAHRYLYKPEPDPGPPFRYDADTSTLHLSDETKRALITWLGSWRTRNPHASVLVDMLLSVRGVVTE